MAYGVANRQDTWSDLQLFGVVNLIVILAFGWLKTNLVDAVEGLSHEDLSHKPFWSSIYEACCPAPASLLLSCTEHCPWVSGSMRRPDSFAVGVAAIGLAAFALVLALVEQVVLQVVDENVARGSRVFETGHVRLPCDLFCAPHQLACMHAYKLSRGR